MHQGISRFRKMAVAAVATVATTAGLLPLAATGAGAAANFDLTRLFGANRYGTAADIATKSFGPSAADVIVTTGENFPDALAGNYLAGTRSAPILLTTRNSVPAETQTAINSLNPQRVWVLGGTDAVGAGGVPTTSGTVTRVQGITRYETAVAASSTGTVGTVGGKPTAIVATGDKFADALSAGPGAYAGHFPLYLTPGAPSATLHPATKQALTQRGITNVILMGGVNAVSAAVASEIQGMGITVTRVEGADRTETARNFAEWLLTNLAFSNATMDVARGDLYPDALAGGPHAGKEKSPILLTWTPTEASPGNSAALGALKYASDHKATLTGGHIFGGIFAVSAAAEQAIEAAGGATTGPAQAFTVTGAGETGTALAPSSRTCTVTAPAGTVLDLQLFATENIVVTSSSVSFADTDSNNRADPGTVTSATITSVEGSPTAGQSFVRNVTSDGSTVVTIQATGADDVTLVVWNDASGLTGDELDLVVPTTANNLPKAARESFGIGCRTVFANEQAGGAFGPVAVTATDKANNFFQAGGSNFFYDANDTFQIGGTPQAAGEAGLAAFEARLSPGDNVSGTYAPDPAGVSTFNLDDAAPVAPASLTTASIQGRNVTLQFPESATTTTDSYNIYQLIRPGNPGAGTCPDFNTATGRTAFGAAVTTVTDPGAAGGTTLTVTRTDLQENSFYCFAVTAVDEGDESATGATVNDVLTGSGTETVPPNALDTELTTSGGFNDRLDGGDVVKVCFNEPLRTPDSGDSIQVTDGTDIATITNGTNATFALGAAATTDVSNGTSTTSCPANQTLVITLTGAPADTNTTTGDNILQLPTTISDAAGVTDLAGNNWRPSPVNGQDVVIDAFGAEAAEPS